MALPQPLSGRWVACGPGLRRQLVYRFLKDVAVVVALDELAPVGGRPRAGEMSGGAASRGRSHPGLRPLANLRFEVGRLLPAAFAWIGPVPVMNAMSRMSPLTCP